MANYYFDSSAFVKLYLREAGSLWVDQIIHAQDQHGERVNLAVFASIGIAEVGAAIARRWRMGALSDHERGILFRRFMNDHRRVYTTLALTEDVMVRAAELTQNFPLRGFDAVHLASALNFHQILQKEGGEPFVFVTSDEVLLQAAQASGLVVENPSHYP